jgi:integrase
MLLNWLAWCLQNEGDKPGWAPFLYSSTKGSGKSTFAKIAGLLFGTQNTATENNINKLVSRFNAPILEQLLDTSLPKQGRLFPYLTVDAVVKRYAKLRQLYPDLQGSVFHSTRKWFITQCERTGTPEYFTASLVGHHSARSANKLTYGLYLAGISDAQKREIVDEVKLPTE